MKELDQLREQIDQIDGQIIRLFEKRMDCCNQVAEVKKENGLPLFHKDREAAILDKVAGAVRQPYRPGARVLFSTLIDISKCLQQSQVHDYSAETRRFMDAMERCPSPPDKPVVAYFGIEGTFTCIAAHRIFPGCGTRSYGRFADVFAAVQSGQVDYGVLPLDNSTAGSIGQVYQLLRQENVFINQSFTLKVEECLAVHPATDVGALSQVYSHPQPLAQCMCYLERKGYAGVRCNSTADAAKYVSEHGGAALCSEETALQYGLRVVEKNVQDADENYTRFIVISKNLYTNHSQDTAAISLSLPHATGALYSLLTKFAVCGVNLTKIESQPMGTRNFDVMFYLNFTGNLLQPDTVYLLNDLSNEFKNFRFLGCYHEG